MSVKRVFSLRPGLSPPGSLDAVLVSLPSRSSVLGRDSALPLENLGLAVLASSLEAQGFSVGLCDADDLELDLATTRRGVLHARAPFIGFTTYQATMAAVLDLATAYKSRYPRATVCVGGYQATFCANDLLANEPSIDVVVAGRGAGVVPQLVANAIRGTTVREIVQGDPPLIPAPPNPKPLWAYRDSQTVSCRRSVSLLSSEGCYGNCAFCSSPAFEGLQAGPKWRPRATPDVLAEMRYLKDAFGVDHFHFHDPDFLGMSEAGWQRAEDIAYAIAALPFRVRIRFAAQARAIAALPGSFWSLWKSAGLERVYVGLESGDDKQLILHRKWSRREHNILALRLLHQNRVASQLGFILFTPDTSMRDVAGGVEFLETIHQAHIFKHFANPLVAYPGSEVFARLQRQGRLAYRKPYLGITCEYLDPAVSRLAGAVVHARDAAHLMDRLFFDLEFGLAGEWSEIATDCGPVDPTLAGELLRIWQPARSASILQCFAQALEGDCEAAFALFSKRDASMMSAISRSVLESTQHRNRRGHAAFQHA